MEHETEYTMKHERVNGVYNGTRESKLTSCSQLLKTIMFPLCTAGRAYCSNSGTSTATQVQIPKRAPFRIQWNLLACRNSKFVRELCRPGRRNHCPDVFVLGWWCLLARWWSVIKLHTVQGTGDRIGRATTATGGPPFRSIKCTALALLKLPSCLILLRANDIRTWRGHQHPVVVRRWFRGVKLWIDPRPDPAVRTRFRRRLLPCAALHDRWCSIICLVRGNMSFRQIGHVSWVTNSHHFNNRGELRIGRK